MDPQFDRTSGPLPSSRILGEELVDSVWGLLFDPKKHSRFGRGRWMLHVDVLFRRLAPRVHPWTLGKPTKRG